MSFDLTEFLDETEQDQSETDDLDVEVPAEDTVEDSQDESEADVELDNYMNEVEKRLEVASFYQALLKNPLFNGSRNKGSGATVVEKEVRAFCRGRLAVLVGLKTEPDAVVAAPTAVHSPFTQEQTDTLIAIANQLLAKNRTTPIPAAMPTSVSGPVVNTVQSSPKTADKPIAKKVVKKAPGKPLYVEKVATDADGNPVLNKDGKPIMIKNQRIQRPTGATPFPADVAMATQMRMNPGAASGAQGPLGLLIGHHLKEE